MENGTAAARQTDEVALWRGRAEQQARRGDRLREMLERIASITGEGDGLAFELENDDRVMCEICGREGWPENGFAAGVDESVYFCADCGVAP